MEEYIKKELIKYMYVEIINSFLPKIIVNGKIVKDDSTIKTDFQDFRMRAEQKNILASIWIDENSLHMSLYPYDYGLSLDFFLEFNPVLDGEINDFWYWEDGKFSDEACKIINELSNNFYEWKVEGGKYTILKFLPHEIHQKVWLDFCNCFPKHEEPRGFNPDGAKRWETMTLENGLSFSKDEKGNWILSVIGEPEAKYIITKGNIKTYENE